MTEDKTMSDRGIPDRDPHYDPRTRKYDTNDAASPRTNNGESVVWILVDLVAAVVVGLMIFNISDLSRTANTPAPETTGRSDRTVPPTPRVSPGSQNTGPANQVPAPQAPDRP